MRTRYLLVTLAIVISMMIERWRGIALVIVLTGGAAFLLAGNFVVYRSGAQARALRRKREMDYWTQ